VKLPLVNFSNSVPILVVKDFSPTHTLSKQMLSFSVNVAGTQL
jgi:hypothetical protein